MSTKRLKKLYRAHAPTSGGGLRTLVSAIALTDSHPLNASAKAWCQRKRIDWMASNSALRLARTMGAMA